MKRALKWIRVVLEVVGAASLIFLTVAAVLIVQQSRDRVNKAGRKDVLLILTRSGIPTNQDFKLIASYESSTTFTGDHLDYYCMELSKFEVADWRKDEWHDGPEKNPIFAEALKEGVDEAHQENNCFPSPEEANSETMKIMFGDVLVDSLHPISADITLYDPKTKKLYYVSYKN